MLFSQEEIRKHLNEKQRKKNKHKNNDGLEETQELNDFIGRFPDFFSGNYTVIKQFHCDDYYPDNRLVTENDMQKVLDKYKKTKKSQNSLSHESKDDNSENSHNDNNDNENSDNENDEKENNNETKSFLGSNQEDTKEKKNAMKSVYKKNIIKKKRFSKNLDIPDSIPEITFKNREMIKNQESSDNSVSQDLKDGVKKQSKNGTTKPDVRNANLSSPYSVKKQSVKTTHFPITNNPLPQPQPVNNKPAETNKSGKTIKDDSTQKSKEKSQDKKISKTKHQTSKKNKHKTKKIINTKSELNNEDQKDQTSNAYIYLLIALGVIVVSVIAFFIYRNFVSNVASSESLQNYATNLLSV